MKKNLPFNLAVALTLSCSISAVAQPTLTGINCNPIIGDMLTYNKSTYVSPGNTGVNQTWNLSGMTTTASASEFVAPASTPSPNIPNANISLQVGSNTYYYFKTNSIAFQNCSDILSGDIIKYTNPEDALQYPFTFNSSFVDTYAGSGSFTSRNGTSTVTADGYGTLITPAGTFTNALRVHIYRDYTDGPGGSLNVNTKMHEYRWYTPDQRFYLASVYTQTNTYSGGSNTSDGGMFISNYSNVVGLKKQSEWSNSISLYPVPAVDICHMKLTGIIPAAIKASLYSSIGTLMMEKDIYTNEKSDLELNLANIPNGVYLIKINGGDDYLVQKTIIVSK